MTLLQIRGANSTGKSTAMRQFCERHGLNVHKVKVGGIPTTIETNAERSIVVLGRYDKPSGGCDRFRNTEHVVATIKAVIAKWHPNAVLFEGFIYSLTVSFALQINEIANENGYIYRAVLLDLPKERQLEWLYNRNGGNKVNAKRIIESQERANVAYDKLREAGIDIIKVRSDKIIKEQMWQIVEERLI